MYVGFIHSHDNSVEADTYYVFADTEYECFYKILLLIKEHHPDNFWNEITFSHPNSVRFITDKDKPTVFLEGNKQKTVEELEVILSDLVSGCDNGDWFYWGCLPKTKFVAELEFNESWYDQGWITQRECFFSNSKAELEANLRDFMLETVTPHKRLEDVNTSGNLKTVCEELNSFTYRKEFDSGTEFKYKILTLPDLKEVS